MEYVRRNTKQRRIVLEELKHRTSHPTATELHAIVRKRLPRISLGTVYRNLELLVREGWVRKLDHLSGPSRFDANLEQHVHIRCVCCGRVDDVPGPPVELSHAEANAPDGYEIFGYHVEMAGICNHCRKHTPPQEIDALRRSQTHES